MENTNKIDFWNSNRQFLNKWLLIEGLIIIVLILLTLSKAFRWETLIDDAMFSILFIGIYIFYIGFSNLTLIIVESIDRSWEFDLRIEYKIKFAKSLIYTLLLLPILYMFMIIFLIIGQ